MFLSRIPITSACPLSISFPSRFELFAQDLSCPEDARPYGGFVDPQGRGDFARRHLFDRRQDERLAQLVGQCCDQLLESRADLCAVDHAVGRCVRRNGFCDRLLRIIQRNLPRPASPLAAIAGDSPRDARQPGFRVVDGRELCAVAQHAQECLLRSIFGVVMAAEHGIGNAIYKSRVLPDQGFDGFVSARSVGARSVSLRFIRAVFISAISVSAISFSAITPAALGFLSPGRCRSVQDRLSRRHLSALNHEDRRPVGSVQVFLEGERSVETLLATSLIPTGMLPPGIWGNGIVRRRGQRDVTSYVSTRSPPLLVPVRAGLPRFPPRGAGSDLSGPGPRRLWLRRG